MYVTRLILCVALATVLAGAASAVGAATLKVEGGAAGLRVVADDARLEEVLDALAATQHFDVVMQPEVDRAPVDVDLHDVTLEQALRAVLRRRNYAISYRETDHGLAVSRVDVLLPEGIVTAAAAASQATAAAQHRRRALYLQQARTQADRERQRQRAVRIDDARAAQRGREAPQAASVPLRRQLWARTTSWR